MGVHSNNHGGLASQEKDPISITGLVNADVPSHQKGMKEQRVWLGACPKQWPSALVRNCQGSVCAWHCQVFRLLRIGWKSGFLYKTNIDLVLARCS